MSLNNPRTFFLLISVFAIAAMVRSHRVLSDWMYTHWLFNYDLEFVKRGLVGESFSLLGIEPSYTLVYVISYFLLFILVAIFVSLIVRLLTKEGRKTGLKWMVLILVFSSATFQHFHHDLGRFDVILVIGALLMGLLSESIKGLWLWLLLMLILTLLVFVHEATFFIVLPFVLAYGLFQQRTKAALLLSIIVFSWVTLVTYQVSTQGKVSKMELSEHLTFMQEKYGDRVTESSLVVLHKTSLDDQFNFVETKLGLRLLEKYIVMFLLLLPLFWLIYRVFKHYGFSNLDRYDFLVLSSTLSPLALSFLGVDFFRWWALFIILLISFILMKANQNSDFRASLNDVFVKSRKLVYTTLLFGLLAGPLGITGPFPMSPF